MPAFAYTTVPGKIPDLMQRIRRGTVPDKANAKWLSGIGFKAQNDRTLIPVLKFIGFADRSGIPTDLWRQYLGSAHESVMASAIMEAYKPLFVIYGSAHSVSTSELKQYFRVETGSADGTASKMAETFKSLCALAHFEKSSGEYGKSIEVYEKKSVESNSNGNGPSKVVHIHIELELPATDDEEVYRRIFEAVRKYLID